MAANRLAGERSAYLRQHAENPVDWFPWGEEAFAKARREQKPIFLSAGYATCHWCHVMERESFTDPDVAAVLNRDFVPVKLDREERPDVDRIYMLFVQATTGGGGWPMSVWMTPDLQPFYGGTYYPPVPRHGRPSFRAVLERIAEAWREERDRILESAGETVGQLRDYSADLPRVEEPIRLDEAAWDQALRIYDSRNGGFGMAPKFPRTGQYGFLLRWARLTGRTKAVEMTAASLRAMARGGMNDQIGGGFHRYSVDARWFIPHFEKMLYDQAQLAVSYCEAWQVTRDPEFGDEARRILDYVLREMTGPDGEFWGAEDADSVPSEGGEPREGAYYLFSWQELAETLGEELLPFAEAHGCRPEGNVLPEEDPHGEFAGRNLLIRLGAIDPLFEAARAELLAARGKRPRPFRDEKVVCAWNGLMISAFARTAQAFGEPRYLDAARRAMEFAERRLGIGSSGVVWRTWEDGRTGVAGFLEDFAAMLTARLDLYEAGFVHSDLAAAVRLADSLLERFAAPSGALYSTADGEPGLVLRLIEEGDGAEPSGNGLAAMALARLGAMTGDARWTEAAARIVRALEGKISGYPWSALTLVMAGQMLRRPMGRVEFLGPRDCAMAEQLRTLFRPFTVLLHSGDFAGPARARFCEGMVCHAETSDAEALASQVE